MKTFVTLLAIVLAMVFVMPAFAGEEPYKAAVKDDSWIPGFYISDKLYQFTHPETSYYDQCVKYVLPMPGVDFTGCEFNGTYYVCPNKCTEKFTYDKATQIDHPEVCCTYDTKKNGQCPDSWCDSGWCKTVKMGSSNPGTYEWVIALPKKPEGELNIEIECGVLKPNEWPGTGNIEDYKTIERCAAITGEQVGSGCTRQAGTALKKGALPTITAIAYPGCLHPNAFAPFHLTAYKNPGIYNLDKKGNHLANRASTQVLDGSYRSRIALKACMEKTILVKWPVEGTLNAYDSDPVEDGLQPEVEANLLAGDLIKVTMEIPTANTVDIFCGKYSVTIGGIGVPIDSDTGALLDDPDSCPCIDDVVCPL